MLQLIDGLSQGQFLRGCREGLTLREAAPLYGVHFNTLLAWENEKKPLPPEKVETARTIHRMICARAY